MSSLLDDMGDHVATLVNAGPTRGRQVMQVKAMAEQLHTRAVEVGSVSDIARAASIMQHCDKVLDAMDAVRHELADLTFAVSKASMR